MFSYPQHTVGVIVVDHGSKMAAANEQLREVVALFKRVSGCVIAEPAHMELAAPSVREAFDRCVAQGATLVVVHPYFLAPGRHSMTDIPRMTAEAAARHPGVRFHVTQPLGLDEKIAALMVRRIEHCLEHDLQCADCRGQGRRCGGRAEPAG
jgi:sirohydrochlorin ferrochelatase